MAASTPIDRLLAQLAPFDQRNVLGAVGAMMTDPRNAAFGLRLQIVAEAAASLGFGGEHIPSTHRLRTIMNGADIMSLAYGEDPAEAPVVEPIFHRGRAYLVIAPQVEEAVFRCESLLWAIDRLSDALDPVLAARWNNVVAAALEVAEDVVRRSGLEAGAKPHPARDVTVTAVDPTRVTWTAEAFEELLEKAALPHDAIDPLVLEAGSGNPGASRDAAETLARPLIRFPDRSVVVLPMHLLIGLAHFLLMEVRTAGLVDALAEAYAAVTVARVGGALATYLGLSPVSAPTPPPAPLPFLVRAFAAAEDALYVLLVAGDPFEPFGADVINEFDPDDAYATQLAGLVEQSVEWGLSQAVPGQRLVLVVCPSLLPNRHGGVPLALPRTHNFLFLPVLPGALCTMALLERSDSLGLAKFALSWRELQETTHVLAFNTLDAYALYRKHDRSFYVGDDRLPNAISIASDFGLESRVEAVRYLGETSFEFPGLGHVPLLRRYPEEAAPIYVAPGVLPGQALLVRGQRLAVWVIGADTAGMSVVERERTAQLLDTLAYWLWLTLPGMERLGGTTAPQTLVLQSQIDRPDNWKEAVPADPDACGAVPAGGGRVVLWVEPAFGSALHGPDNRVERWLVVLAVRALLMELGRDATIDEAIEVVDSVVTSSQQKMLILLTDESSFDLGGEDGLASWTKADDWTSGRILDELGGHLSATGHAPGAAGGLDDQVALLNASVTFMLGLLAAELADLSPDGAVERLLEHNEALIRELAMRRLQTPTRVACFGPYSDIIERLAAETRALSTASVANRFLLEYVAATPPAGAARLDRWRYERLLGIAAHIVNLGFASDVTRNGLGVTDARVLPSGRLGMRRDGFGSALESYARSLMPSQVRIAQESFEERWSRGPAEPPTELETAFAAEFGYTLTEIASVVGAMNRLVPVDTAIGKARRSVVVAAGAAGAGITEEKAAAIIDSLTLGPRDAFMEAPEGYSRTDIFPWVYNRRLSFVRRPVVSRGGPDDPQLVWGWRGAAVSVRQVVALVHEGRLPGVSSKEMRAYSNAQTTAASDAFVADVATLVSSAGMDVRTNIKKFGKVRMVDAANRDIGDVDVLGIDQAHRVLWAIECKNLVFAKTPRELRLELDELTKPGKGMIAKHDRRLVWMHANMPAVTAGLGLPGGHWSVVGLICVHTDLLSLHVRQPSMPVVPFDQLRSYIDAHRTHRR